MLFLQFRFKHVVIDTHVNLIQTGLANAVVCIYFRGYVNLRFKHAVEGTHRSCLRCLGQQVSHLLFVRKKSEKKRKKKKEKLLWIGTGTEMRTDCAIQAGKMLMHWYRVHMNRQL